VSALQEGLAQREGLWYRPDTADINAIRDVNRMLRRPGGPEPTDVVLDIGAHIGAFSLRALDRGAALVKAVEPEPSNIALFRKNVVDPRVQLVEAAAGAGVGGWATLHVKVGKATDSHSLTRTGRNGQELLVPVLSLAQLCQDFAPTYVKVDIEGAEYTLDLVESFPGSADRLFIEFHFHKQGDRERALALRKRLVGELGFELLWGSNWTQGAWWVEETYQR
jgi:FkbM family methyltransferase